MHSLTSLSASVCQKSPDIFNKIENCQQSTKANFLSVILELSVDAGASIVKEDQIDSSLLEDSTMNRVEIGLAASLSLGIVNSSSKYQFSYSNMAFEKYMKSVRNSDIRTHSGPSMNPESFILSEWTTTIGNDLVAVDRNGLPLDYVISTTSLPELSKSLVMDVVQNVRNAISSYFKHNTYPGCTNPDAPNFTKISNLDDGSCHEPFTYLSFGGVYQECHVQGSLINNDNLCYSLATEKSSNTGICVSRRI